MCDVEKLEETNLQLLQNLKHIAAVFKSDVLLAELQKGTNAIVASIPTLHALDVITSPFVHNV